MSPSPSILLSVWFAVLAAAAQLGCSEARPSKVLRLEVTRVGQYVLEGQELTDQQLRDALAAANQSSGPVELEIHASPEANYQRVGNAVVIAQSQQIALLRFASPSPLAASSAASSAK